MAHHDKEKFEIVKLTDIEVVPEDNARSGAWDQNDGSGSMTGEMGFLGSFDNKDEGTKVQGGLVGSIRKSGQDTPVWVRPNPDPKRAAKVPYRLVSGFRRFKAIEIINAQTVEIPGLPAGSIKVLVKTPPVEEKDVNAWATALNLKENMDREGLSNPDQAYAMYKLEKDGWTQVGIALHCGVSQAWVSRLMSIMNNVPAKLTKAWRSGTMSDGKTAALPLGVEQMLTLIPPPKNPRGPATAEDAATEYDRMCKAKGDVQGAGEEGGKDKWVEKLTKRAVAVGTLLGRLVGLEAIDEIDAQRGTWGEIVKAAVPTAHKSFTLTAKQEDKLVQAGIDAFKDAKKKAAEGEDEEENDDAEAKTGTRAKAKGNSQEATA